MTRARVTFETIILIVTGLALAAIMSVYVISTSRMQRTYDAPLVPVAVPTGAAAVAEGERLARVRGCFWCHGQQLEGQKYFAEPEMGVIAIAPDLTRKYREYGPDIFARTVRHGVRPDGTSLQPAMPSFAFFNMSDADIGYIMAYIDSLPEQNGYQGKFKLLPVGWARVAAGELPPNVAELIDHESSRPDPSVGGDPLRRGRYLAESICTECHSDNGRLRVPGSPDLIVASAYIREQFYRLMRTGVTLDDRPIDYHMVDAAKYRYTLLRDDEVEALYVYFRSLAGLEP